MRAVGLTLTVFLLLIAVSGLVAAQESIYPVISAENAHQLSVVHTISSRDFPPDYQFRGAVRFTFHPASSLLAIALNGGIGLVDTQTGETIALLGEGSRHFNQSVSDMTFSPDGTLLAVAGYDGLTVWDIEARAARFTGDLPGTLSSWGLGISDDNRLLFAEIDRLNETDFLSVWDIDQGEEIDRNTVCDWFRLIRQYGLCLTSFNASGMLQRIDLETYELIEEISAANLDVFALPQYLTVGPDMRTLAAGYSGYEVIDLESLEIITQIDIEGSLYSFQIDPQGSLVVQIQDNRVVVLNVATDDIVFQSPQTQVWYSYNYIGFSPDGTLLAIGESDTSQIDLYAVSPCSVASDARPNLRSGPGTDFDIIGILEPGERLAVLSQEQTGNAVWYRLAGERWVRSDIVTVQGEC